MVARGSERELWNQDVGTLLALMARSKDSLVDEPSKKFLSGYHQLNLFP